MAAKVKALQEWCKRQCEGYRDVNITNMTSSWKSGLAFCAIIHRYRPDLIDYNSLSKEDVYENNKLAFTVGETIGIPALLDAEDMVVMAVPDKLCIITYVAQYYNVFRDKTPAGGPGKSAQAVKRPSAGVPPSRPPDSKRPTPKEIQISEDTGNASQKSSAALGRRGTYGENCHMCGGKVYLLERHIDGSTLYHRYCFRTSQKSQSKPSTYTANLHPGDAVGHDGVSSSRETAGRFDTQNRNRTARDFKSTPEGGMDKSLSAGVSSQEKNSSSHTRSHPYSKQPAAENKVDKIAELFKETEKAKDKAASSKNLLLAGYTSNVYKPITVNKSSVFSGASSTTSKPSLGLTTVSSAETKHYTTTITSKSAGTGEIGKTVGSDIKSKSAVSQGAGTFMAATGRPQTVTQKAEGLESTKVSKNETPSDPAVVSGLLQSLAQVRNKDSKGTAFSESSVNHPTSNVKNVGGKEHNVQILSRTTVNNNDNLSQGVSKTGVNIRSPISPKCKYLQITKPQNVPNTSKVVNSQSSQSSITQPSSSSITTRSTTKTTTTVTVNSKDVKPNIPKSTSQTTSVSIINKSPHSTSSKTAKTQENKPNKLLYSTTMKETQIKQPKSILKIRPVEPNKQAEDELEIDWTTPDPTLKTNGHDVLLSPKAVPNKSLLKSETNDFPVAPPRKSILKKKDGIKQQEVTSMQTHLNAKTSRTTGPRKDINTFNLTDSVEMSRGELSAARSKNKRNEMQKVEIEIRSKEENSKPEWMIEAEKRQKMRGGKYIDPEKKWKTDDASKTTSTNNNCSSSQSPIATSQVQVKQPGTGTKGTFVKQREDFTSINKTRSQNWELNVRQNAEKVRPGGLNGDKYGVSDSKPEWMKEAERRMVERNGQYIDPEKNTMRKTRDIEDGRAASPRSPPPRPATSPQISPRTPASPLSPGWQKAGISSSPVVNGDARNPVHKKRPAPKIPDHLSYTTSPTHRLDTSPGRRLIPGNLKLSSPLNGPEERRPLRKITVEEDFQFSSFEASTDWDAINLRDNSPGQRSPIYYPSERASPVPPPVPPKNFGDDELSPTSQRIQQIQNRPLPTPPLRSPGCDGCNATKRTVQAENRLSFTDMAIQLEELDKQLQILEGEGRTLEDKIRSDTEEAMDEDELMVQWFELVNAKNDLVRKEADLMYQQRQQELEVLHEELEYDLRCLMNKPDFQKSPSEKVREASLLQELLDTVSQRNLIVDSMEEDRIRYIEEDEEIANVMAAKGYSKNPPKTKHGKHKKNKKEKKKKS